MVPKVVSLGKDVYANFVPIHSRLSVISSDNW